MKSAHILLVPCILKIDQIHHIVNTDANNVKSLWQIRGFITMGTKVCRPAAEAYTLAGKVSWFIEPPAYAAAAGLSLIKKY